MHILCSFTLIYSLLVQDFKYVLYMDLFLSFEGMVPYTCKCMVAGSKHTSILNLLTVPKMTLDRITDFNPVIATV